MDSITIKDIARECGVGVSTVSRAINNHPEINQHTKARIMKFINENNYIPNNSARNLKRTESNTIAVLIKGITNPFFNSMLKVFETEIQKKRYSFLLHRVEEHGDEINVALQLEKEKRLKGIVFLGGYFSESVKNLQRLNVPFILSTGGISDKIDKQLYPFVIVDDYKESYKIVDYLCKLGHKKIAIITTPQDYESMGNERFYGYKQALEDNQITLDNDLIRCCEDKSIDIFSMKYGYMVTKELLESKIEFTSLFAISDSIAVGACKAIIEAGKRVPEDYSIAGYDGLDISFYYNPSITTIRQPVEEMSLESIRILFDIINKKESIKHKIFDADLVIGESTKAI